MNALNIVLDEIEKKGLTAKILGIFIKYIEIDYIENHLIMLEYLMNRYSISWNEIIKEPIGRLRTLFSLALQTRKYEPDSQTAELISSFLIALTKVSI